MLSKLAVAYISNGEMKRAPVLYRNKPTKYWADIKRNHNYIMKPYMKDNNGDPGSPINHNINGLFFGATLLRGNMPHTSPFGNLRFTISIERLLRPNMNVYFADFYCIEKNHYVTVVVCTPGSDADNFCQSHLPQLDLFDNPFICISLVDFHAYVSTQVWTEVFITDDVNIWEEMQYGNRCFDLVPTIGRGSSLKDGLVKNLACKDCNLYVERAEDVMFRPRKRQRKSLDKSNAPVNEGKKGTKRKAEDNAPMCKRHKCL